MDLTSLENILIGYIFEQFFGTVWRGKEIHSDLMRSFCAHAERLSDSFTSNRHALVKGYFQSPEARSAYLLYFHLANMVRGQAVFDEIERRNLWPEGELSILDWGSGSAPSLWGAALKCKSRKQKIKFAIAADREKGVLHDARELFRRFSVNQGMDLPELKTFRTDMMSSASKLLGEYDLITVSNVLNELHREPEAKILAMMDMLRKRLTPHGLLIIVEPALQAISRTLTGLRDRMLERMACSVPLPCGHGGGCPLNQEPRDWCHFEARWESPPVRRRIERSLAHRTGNLKYSYLVIQSGKVETSSAYRRVLSNPLATPRGDLLLVCSPEKKVSLKFDRREKSLGAMVAKASRGDLVGGDFSKGQEGQKRAFGDEIVLDPTKITASFDEKLRILFFKPLGN